MLLALSLLLSMLFVSSSCGCSQFAMGIEHIGLACRAKNRYVAQEKCTRPEFLVKSTYFGGWTIKAPSQPGR